ncbi:M23 family metallopeptidase [Demetria terragena]|uniref:M23 family metallopeptidase n=1 Tax=Demetria terragena TaxID=63959 RepID=UPI00037F9A68|nr:M23 family metallopeptidase [Demetria terragena]
MRTLRNATALAAVTSTTLVGLGMSPVSEATAAPTPAAASSSAMDGTKCTEASRFFQLRAEGTELWVASVSRANTAKPTVYSWTKAYDIPGGKGTAVAAHSTSPSSKGIQLLLSDEHGSLRSLNYEKAKSKVTSHRTLAAGTADKPGSYRYTSLTSDGSRLWGVQGGKLHVMTGVSTTKAPTGRATVSGLTGFWPRALAGMSSGSHEIAWTDSKGALTYADVTSTGGWKIKSKKVVTKGPYTSEAIASPGGNILMRSDGESLLRYRASAEGVKDRDPISSTWKVNNNYPMTTVADVCSATSPSGNTGAGGYSLPLERNAQPRSEYDDPHHDYPAIDMAIPTGTKILAVRGGTVTHVSGGCGLGILVKGDDGAEYTYCHLDSRGVANGAKVKAGQQLGLSGNTGHSTGPHLHLQLRSGGELRCPQKLLLAVYDGKTPPSPSALPSSGCTN